MKSLTTKLEFLRGVEPRADSLEISRFLPSFLGKMAVFDKTESLQLMFFAKFQFRRVQSSLLKTGE